MFSFVLHAWKSWKSAKAVGLLAAIALAAGIGSATAIYTVVDAVLIQPVPWPHSERFVSLFSARLDTTSRGEWASTSWLDLTEYQQKTRSFDGFGVFLPRDFRLTAPGQPQHLTVAAGQFALMMRERALDGSNGRTGKAEPRNPTRGGGAEAAVSGQTSGHCRGNAGHNPPCLLRCSAEQSIEELPAGGTVIGLFPQSSYEESVLDLQPGEFLLHSLMESPKR